MKETWLEKLFRLHPMEKATYNYITWVEKETGEYLGCKVDNTEEEGNDQDRDS